MIVLDARVLIGFLDGDDNHHAAAQQLLTQAIDDDLGVTSLTLAEVLVAPVRDGRPEPVLAALQALAVRELPFPADTALRLAELRATTGLKMPDCCVILAAEDAAATVASFDERLRPDGRRAQPTRFDRGLIRKVIGPQPTPLDVRRIDCADRAPRELAWGDAAARHD